MNNPAITKEDLLKVAEEIVKHDGLEKLNIRLVAKECNISVGCIYNYFPSKSELIFAMIEKFWNKVIHKAAFDKVKSNSFVELIDETYHSLSLGLEGFTADFLNQMSSLDLRDKLKGKEIEAHYWQHMKIGMIKVLDQDKGIGLEVWTNTINKTAFVDFVFENMMMSLRKGETDCALLLELIKRSLYR